MATFTVFTPTFNRAHTLHRVYNSLCNQTYKDFQWLIIDDGSTDNTRKLIESWKGESKISIKYVFQENQGKHGAINNALKIVQSTYFIILDSDDSCEFEALDFFYQSWSKICHDGSYAAVVVLCKGENGEIDGNRFPNEVFDSNHLMMALKYRMKGEKWECWRTDVIKSFPFPSIGGRSVVPESLILNRIARSFRCRYMNKALRTYHDDGMDSSLVRVSDPSKNSLGGVLVYQEFLGKYSDFFWVNPLYYFLSAIKLARNSIYQKLKFSVVRDGLESNLARLLFFFCYPVGRLICDSEKMLKKNFSGKSNFVKT